MSASVPSGAGQGAFVHATALVVGEAGVLVRGGSGSGKTSLACLLLWNAQRDGRFARLVGDDRVALSERNGRIVARSHPAIQGKMERRTVGIVTVPFEPACVVKLVVDLMPGSEPVARLPDDAEASTEIFGVRLPRLAMLPDLGPLTCKTVLEKLSSTL